MSEFLTFLIAGVVSGAIYAVTATGLVVTYNTTGVFNFAHGATGMLLAFVFWQLWQGWGIPVLVALALVLLVCAPLLGAVVERTMMRHLHGTATGVPLVVTTGLLLLLFGLANSIWNQNTARSLPNFFPNDQVSVGQVSITAEQLITMAVAVVVAVSLRLFFKRTRTGVAMRAVVDDPELAALHGAPPRRLAAYAWMIGTMLAALAGILLAPQTNMNILELTLLVVYGYAAAVVGRLRNLPLTVAGALVLGIANAMAIGYAPPSAVSYITAALPMGLLLLALLVLPQARLAVGRIVRERPPRVLSARQSAVGAAGLVVLSVVLALTLGGTSLNTLGLVLVLGLLGLSLVPLSGYAGQISLCQYTFLGLGCVVMAKVGGGDSVLGVLAAIGVCAACGAVLALPALRLRGLYLALATLAFAVLMDNLFFTSTSVMGQGGTLTVGRPDIFGVRFASERSFIVLVAGVLALCTVGVGALRRSAFGRRLVGMNDSPAACATAGLNLTATKLIVFTLSAGLAGLAGALYGGLEGTVGASQFDFLLSLAFFLALTIAGVASLSGPVVAGVFLAVVPVIASYVPGVPDLLYLAAGAGAISIGRSPNGMARVVSDVADAWRRRRGSPVAAGPPPALSVRGVVDDVGVRSVG
jgi:branched-chain amino acid transport system permease protein